MTPDATLIITCEHGGNVIPMRYAPLFAPEADLLGSHRGHDIGALAAARYLATHLDAPLHYSTVSRLLIDLNRSLHHRQIFSSRTRALDASSRRDIVRRYYWPYRDAVERRIARAITRGRAVIHLSVHSFTPALNGRRRTADVGLLYDPARRGERRFCARLRGALRDADPALRVRRNYPYRGTADGFTTYLRRTFPGTRYTGVEIEINQRFFLDAGRAWPRVRRALLRALKTTVA